jgi:uncharacterized membrane protein
VTTVTTREELKKAQESGVQEIVVVGELADKLKQAKKVASLSAAGLAALTAVIGVATVTAPVTGGLSYAVAAAGAAPVAAMTGLEVAAIITASFLGIGLLVALFSGYEEISFKEGELVLRKKQK